MTFEILCETCHTLADMLVTRVDVIYRGMHVSTFLQNLMMAAIALAALLVAVSSIKDIFTATNNQQQRRNRRNIKNQKESDGNGKKRSYPRITELG